MNKITHKIVNRLANFEGRKALTIYMPTVDAMTPSSLQENQIRFKNLINQGIEQLDDEQDASIVSALNTLMKEKMNDSAFWQDLTHGLAIFASDEGIELYHLPIEIAEQVYVGTIFDTLALYEMQSMYQPFYLFALAQHDPKIFSGDIYGLEPIEIDFPHSTNDALNIDEMFANSNTIRSGSGTMNQAAPHGQGDSQEAGQEERLMYLRILDDKIQHSKLIDHELPIIIAATDSEAGDFRAVSKLPNILQSHISGNRTKDSFTELHRLALETFQTEMAEKKRSMFEELYEEKRGADKATNDINEIQRAAETGRVDTLVLGVFEKTNDTVADNDPHASSMHMSASRPEKSTLLRLVRTVLRNGGNVQAINRMFIPGRTPAAAVLRY